MESILHLELARNVYKQGIPESESIHRLRDTARKLLGEIEMGPDLATQLMASGPQTHLGMSQQDFGRWLMARVEQLENNRIPNDLVEWIAGVEPHLRFLESEIISWLKDVRDFRYPVAMYKAAISYFDHQVGVFLDALRSHGIYDDSAIIFLSPHGEVLDEHDLHFHHHVLFESVLRIPAIVKPPVDCAFTPGSAIAGVFDLIDVYPTVIEMLGCTAPSHLAGVSRWPSISQNRSIPVHDSFAVDAALAAASIHAAPYRLTKILEWLSFSPSLTLGPGHRILLNLDHDTDTTPNDRLEREPDIAVELEARLDNWLTSHGVTLPQPGT